MKVVRADFRFMVPDDFDGTAVDGLVDAARFLSNREMPELKHTACFPTAYAENKSVNGNSPFVWNSKLGHRFTGFVGAYGLTDEFGAQWTELPSGIFAHGSGPKGWIK